MRLSKIKLSGFKSFVDPTTISFPSNLVGVVGPNGCGKSNVIDAVRWVMGESSASRLRGDSMTDVIFNGSSARKPVGTASIELLFDNSDGTVGGQYASFSEISIRRSVSRDGLSTYFLNGTKCRRKDITGIFLGTGLGPRSYSIIEQGMISRLIEAKPEEMRVYVEEAAGISKYKERRRETETRIRHTRENLERLTDLLEEVEKQIKHLNRQAKTAERYKKLKADQRRMSAELVALRLQDLDRKTERHERELAENETRFEAAMSEQRRVEAAIEAAREQHAEATETFNDVQGRFYKVGAEIARLEQSIEHGRELRERQLGDLREASDGAREIREHIDQDQTDIEQLTLALNELVPGLEAARERERRSAESLQRSETAMADWREKWDAYRQSVSDAERSAEVEAARIAEHRNALTRLSGQQERIRSSAAEISLDTLREAADEARGEAAVRETRAADADEKLERVRGERERARERERELDRQVRRAHESLQATIGRYTAARAMQKAALGGSRERVENWLAASGYRDRSRLAQSLTVENGWERAVETVLGDQLQAVSVADLEQAAAQLRSLDGGRLMLIGESAAQAGELESTLASRVRGAPATIAAQLARVRVADSLNQALEMRYQLEDHESIVTRAGEWIGRDFVRVDRAYADDKSVLEREAELRSLKQSLQEQRTKVDEFEATLEQARQALADVEKRLDEAQQVAAASHRAQSDVTARVEGAALRLSQAEDRLGRSRLEINALSAEMNATEQRIAASEQRRREAKARHEELSGQREALEAQRGELEAELARVSAQAAEDREARQAVQIQFESRRSSRESASQSLERMRRQLGQFESREKALQAQIQSAEQPLADRAAELEGQLEERVNVERSLGQARRALEEVDDALRRLDEERSTAESGVARQRELADEARMAVREAHVRREGLLEQFDSDAFALETIVAEMPEGAAITTWDEELGRLTARIDRLGPINLAAIDEFREQSERKEYLDKQLEDLQSALETLENAIRKIDRETRTRFKETYDKIDAGFKQLFPRLFGGGHAYLELTGDDLLTAGVTVMARPPGKRNSTIHLLSGGEKALTAVALVFAIFELNPAPFCMLDEVDAPLDDANVARYCEIVKAMSENVQFIFITHNKVTMEMARQLSGVTMQEPGVSRLVTVDLDEAVKMAVS